MKNRRIRRTVVNSAVVETLENRQLLSLVVDLRLPGGAKSATVSSVGQVFNLEIWATANGGNASGSDEGLQVVIGSLLSTGTAVKGNLDATPASPFNGFGSQDGVQRDLDGDGDLDVGSNITEEGSDYFAARSGGVTTTGTVSGNSKAFKIGTASFTVTSFASNGSASLNFRTRAGVTALWREDGAMALKNPNTGSFTVGSPVVLTRGSGTVGSISGLVYNDANKNNTREAGEVGIAGAQLFLDTDKDGVKDAGETATTTDGGGNYFFSGLATGSYRVREIAPGGFNITNPSSAFHDVTLTTGQNVGDRNFANQPTGDGGGNGSISGLLFSDANKNGVFDTGDTRLSARKMYRDNNSNGKFDTGEPSTLTNGNGEYTFSSLPAGTYRIGRADTPAGYSFSTPSGGIHIVALAAGQNVTGRNFGVFQGTGGGGGNGSISGLLFSDANKNGVFDTGDTRLSARKMYLDSNSNGKFDSGEANTLTNSNGDYTFSNLPAGTYRVGRADTPAGYSFSTPSGGIHIVALAAGQNVTGRNFGVFQGTGGGGTGSIAGIVFSDTDKDGVLDTGETRLASKIMFIDADKDGVKDAGEITVTTNASGEFKFSGLAAGTYRIRRADLPGGYKFSNPSSGFYDVVLTAGQNVTGRNFGAVPV